MRQKLFILGFTLASATLGQAQVLVQYTAPGGSFLPTALADDVLASALNDTGSGAVLEAGASVPDTVFLRQGILSTNAAQAVANNQYFQFTVAPVAGNELDLTNLTFDASRGGASTPRGWVLRSSRDGFAADIATADIPTQQPTFTPFAIDLSAASFQNITSQVTFRIYGYAPATGGVGSFYDNVTLNGLSGISTVPEPASLALLGAGFAVLLRRRRK